MPTYHVLVAQYYRQVGPNGVRPYHWELCVHTATTHQGEPVGHAYHVGGSSAQGYAFEAKHNVRFKSSIWYRGAVAVGAVRSENLEGFEKHLQQVDIVNYNPEWDCQNWVHAALRRLKAQEYLDRHWSLEQLRMELKLAEELWERGDD